MFWKESLCVLLVRSTNRTQKFTLRSSKGEIVSFFESLFRGKRDRSAQVAKERLLTVLVHDRVKLTPESLAELKVELSAVIARYVPQIDPSEIEVNLVRGEANDHLKADIPIRRAARDDS